ncbi:MAG TPA: cytochrome c oxidase subunit 3 [Gemmatimonadales bacterium]|nr:cytochrome c oxidase subunit 3 [Gemmatimonadales bacterium]
MTPLNPYATATAPLKADWQGGVSPFGVPWQKLMMWLFLVTDALLFAGFLGSYGFVRLANGGWPDRSHIFSLPFIGLMTFVLITSSATMASAVGAAHRRDLKLARRLVLLTAIGGLFFIGCQAREWTSLIMEGARLSSNPWGVPAFSGFFFMITGFHGTHVLIGIVVLLILFARLSSGRATEEGVELVGLYWHFVDLVWVFIFTCFYLL